MGGIEVQCKMVARENARDQESADTVLPPADLVLAWSGHLDLVCVSLLIWKLGEIAADCV